MTRPHGFTLIELAIVLVIITILVGGLAVPLSAQIQARRVAETRASMQAIQDAILGYAMSHTKSCSCSYDPDMDSDGDGDLSSTNPSTGCSDMCPLEGAPSNTLSFTRHYLPCPDDGTGIEAARSASGRCTTARGRLAWKTLGVGEADAWGQRFTYAVTPGFTDNDNGFISTSTPFPTASPATTPTNGTLDIYNSASCSGAGPASDAAVIIISHGPNGRGAQNVSGGTPLPPASVPADERQNLPTYTSVAPCNVANTDFVSRTADTNFDDIVVWMSPNMLFSRVCPSGGCL